MITQVINNYTDNFIRIEYMLGNVCNYRCSYCFPGSNEGTHQWPDIELVKTNLGHLLDHYKANGKNKFQFYMVGGEPTIWKDLPELAAFLKSRYNAIINLSTNASRTLHWWQKNTKHYDYVEISVHHEYADVDHIINVADMLYDADTNVVANVLMDPDYFERGEMLIRRLQNSKRQWPVIAKIVKFNGATRYNEQQTTFFDQQTKRAYDREWYQRVNKDPVVGRIVWVVDENNVKTQLANNSWFTLNDQNHFQGWQCDLGKEFIEISKEGIISGNCRQYIYGLDYHFNIYDNDFVEKFQPNIVPTTCRKETCDCTSEIVIKKKKNA